MTTIKMTAKAYIYAAAIFLIVVFAPTYSTPNEVAITVAAYNASQSAQPFTRERLTQINNDPFIEIIIALIRELNETLVAEDHVSRAHIHAVLRPIGSKRVIEKPAEIEMTDRHCSLPQNNFAAIYSLDRDIIEIYVYWDEEEVLRGIYEPLERGHEGRQWEHTRRNGEMDIIEILTRIVINQFEDVPEKEFRWFMEENKSQKDVISDISRKVIDENLVDLSNNHTDAMKSCFHD